MNYIILILCLVILTGCNPAIPDESVLPVGDIFKIEIEPKEITIKIGESYKFTIHAYTVLCEEVYINGDLVNWTKCCGVGELNPIVGLSTIYTAPDIAGNRNISAHYKSLSTGTTVNVTDKYERR